MYYTGDQAIEGLAFGVTAGVHHGYSGDAGKMEHDSAPVAGVLGQYNWLVGNNSDWMVGIGIRGSVVLKTLFNDSPLRKTDRTVRLVVGWVF